MNRQREGLIAFFLDALITTIGARAHAAEPSIVEAARKEGTLVAYVSMLTENATATATLAGTAFLTTAIKPSFA